jgi:DNA-binding transcriptional LysR family regulator
VLDDLHALVEFAQAGSIAGAADRLFRTPSAITRQLQRLEAALGAELLDRSVKPQRLNSLGSKVLEQARDLLQRTEALKSLERLAAEKISVSACDLRELTRDRRVHLGGCRARC